jgi:hypothetical protein
VKTSEKAVNMVPKHGITGKWEYTKTKKKEINGIMDKHDVYDVML